MAVLETVTPALEVNDIVVRFGGVAAVNGVSLKVPAGGIVGLIGPNGAGKTTLVNVITGTVRAAAGTIVINGAPAFGPPHRRARGGLARTFQHLELFESLTVRENVSFRNDVMSGRWRVLALPRWRRVTHTEPPEVESTLAALKLSDVQDLPVAQVSYAERKLAEFGRAIVGDGKVLLLDEPVAGVALEDRPEIIGRMGAVIRSRSLSALIIEHDLAVIDALCDMVYVMDMGEIIGEGSLAEILADDQVRAAYLGSGVAGAATK